MSDTLGEEVEFAWQRHDDRPGIRVFPGSQAAHKQEHKAAQEHAKHVFWSGRPASKAPKAPTSIVGAKSQARKKETKAGFHGDGDRSSSDESDNLKETFIEWKPDVRKQPLDHSNAAHHHEHHHKKVTESDIEHEIEMHRHMATVRKRGTLIAGDLSKKKLVQKATDNTHKFLIFSKSKVCVEKMSQDIENHQQITSTSRYKQLADTLSKPKNALKPFLHMCDVESAETFIQFEHTLSPIVQDSKRRHLESKDTKSEDDDIKQQTRFLKESREQEHAAEAAYKAMIHNGAACMDGAVKQGSKEFAKAAKEIASLKKEHIRRKQAYSEYYDEMAELERRQHYIGGIIEGVEKRKREFERQRQEKIQQMNAMLHTAKRRCDRYEQQCKDEILRSRSVMSRIEAKIEGWLFRHVDKMLSVRLERQANEIRFQERKLNFQKSKVAKENAGLRAAVAEAEHELNCRLGVHQVLELRQRALEGEALLIELEIRCREVKHNGSIRSLTCVESGIFSILERELDAQIHWFVDRCQRCEYDRATFVLCLQSPLSTPLALLKCMRSLLWGWKQQEEHDMESAHFREKPESASNLLKSRQDFRRGVEMSAGSAFANLVQTLAARKDQDVGVTDSGLPLGPTTSEFDPHEDNVVTSRADPYRAVLALHTSVLPEDREFEEVAFGHSKTFFERDVNDLIMEAVLKRKQLQGPLRKTDRVGPRFLKEMARLPHICDKVNAIQQRWSRVRDVITTISGAETVCARIDELIADLLDGRDVASACAHWVTEGARIPGAFSDILVMELAWLPRFCSRLAERAGSLRGVVTVLETESNDTDQFNHQVTHATSVLLRSMKTLMNAQTLRSAEDWMLRVIRILHDQLCLHLSCNSALRWYCGKFYGQGGADLKAISCGLDVIQRLSNAPQLTQTGADKRLLAGEVSAEIRRGLTKFLRRYNPQAYESALLSFDVLEGCTRGEPIGSDFQAAPEMWADDQSESGEVSNDVSAYCFRGSIPLINLPLEYSAEEFKALEHVDSENTYDHASTDERVDRLMDEWRQSVTACDIGTELLPGAKDKGHSSADEFQDSNGPQTAMADELRSGSALSSVTPILGSEGPDCTSATPESLSAKFAQDQKSSSNSCDASPVQVDDDKVFDMLLSSQASRASSAARSEHSSFSKTSSRESPKSPTRLSPSPRDSPKSPHRSHSRASRSHSRNSRNSPTAESASEIKHGENVENNSAVDDGKHSLASESRPRQLARFSVNHLISRAWVKQSDQPHHPQIEIDSESPSLGSSESESWSATSDEMHETTSEKGLAPEDSAHDVVASVDKIPTMPPRTLTTDSEKSDSATPSSKSKKCAPKTPKKNKPNTPKTPKAQKFMTHRNSIADAHSKRLRRKSEERRISIKNHRRSQRLHLINHDHLAVPTKPVLDLSIEGHHADHDMGQHAENFEELQRPSSPHGKRSSAELVLFERVHKLKGFLGMMQAVDEFNDNVEKRSTLQQGVAAKKRHTKEKQNAETSESGAIKPEKEVGSEAVRVDKPAPVEVLAQLNHWTRVTDIATDDAQRKQVVRRESVEIARLKRMQMARMTKPVVSKQNTFHSKEFEPVSQRRGTESGTPKAVGVISKQRTFHRKDTEPVSPTSPSKASDAWSGSSDDVLLDQLMHMSDIPPLMVSKLLHVYEEEGEDEDTTENHMPEDDGSKGETFDDHDTQRLESWQGDAARELVVDLERKPTSELPTLSLGSVPLEQVLGKARLGKIAGIRANRNTESAVIKSPHQVTESLMSVQSLGARDVLFAKPRVESQGKVQQRLKSEMGPVGATSIAILGPSGAEKRSAAQAEPPLDVDDWLKKCRQKVSSTMPWFDKIRAERASEGPPSSARERKRGNLVATPDVMELPGVQACLFEWDQQAVSSSSAPTSLDSRGAQYIPPKAAVNSRAVPDSFDPLAQQREVSTFLQNGQLCGSPGTKVCAEICTGQDSADPGIVLRTTPSLLYLSEKPLGRTGRIGGKAASRTGLNHDGKPNMSQPLPGGQCGGHRRRRHLYTSLAEATPCGY